MDAYWNTVGTTDKDLISFLINPMFMGAPEWPNTRQAYRIVRTKETLIITSHGLSDPWPAGAEGRGPNRFGFGMEVFIELKGLQALSFEEIKRHWAFVAVENLAKNVANAGGFVPLLDEFGVLSIELPVGEGPSEWVKDNGHLGGLIGVSMDGRVSTVATPIKPVRIVPIAILTIPEIDDCPTGNAASSRLAEELVAKETGTSQTQLERRCDRQPLALLRQYVNNEAVDGRKIIVLVGPFRESAEFVRKPSCVN